MKTILEQSFEEMYNLVKERVLKCIQPVDQLDTFTKFMMFETLNQILLEVFGESRYMYLIKVTDTTFVVSFLDRYKIDQTKSLVIPFVNVFEFPDKDTVMQMSLEELEDFATKVRQAGISYKDLPTHYNMGESWFTSLLQSRREGRMPNGQRKWRMAQIPNTNYHVRLAFSIACELEKYGIPLVLKFTPCTNLEKNMLLNALKCYRNTNRTDYCDALTASIDQKEIDDACIKYCTVFHDTINSMLNKGTHMDRYHKGAVSRTLGIDSGVRYGRGRSYQYVYSNADQRLLTDIDQKLIQLINNTKGGKEND